MKKECKYVLMPTRENTEVFIEKSGIATCYKTPQRQTSSDGGQFIYIISKDEIQDVQYTRQFPNISSHKNEYFLHDERKVLGKIIATTNPDLCIKWSYMGDARGLEYSDAAIDLPSISQSDIEYIISLYNGKGKEFDVDKLAFDILNKNLPKDTAWKVEVERGVRNAMKEIYNQCLQDNADKMFTLEDMDKAIFDAIDMYENLGEKMKLSDIIKNVIESFNTDQPKIGTVMVEYYEEVSPMGDGSAWFPKIKDGCIVLEKKIN